MLSESQKNALRLLRDRAQDGGAFSASDLERVAGWTKSSFDTFKTKQLKSYLLSAGKGTFTVKPHFMRLTEEDFEDIVSQTRRPVAKFVRKVYEAVLEYEFLLPLTNERKLRSALDELFYRDHLVQRAREIGLDALATAVGRNDGEDDETYLDRVVSIVGSLLSGYSIGHVHGRFRAGPLRSHSEAAEVLAQRGRYLVDETTAVVRFLLPLQGSRSPHGDRFDVTPRATATSNDDLEEADTARRLFIAFFVENAILSIHAEDEIWFFERGPAGNRLYVLERAPATPTAAKPKDDSARQLALGVPHSNALDGWLRDNDYGDIADRIARIAADWETNNLKTRRNWWEVLAGDKNGKARAVAGQTFPIIASIRHRQGLPPAVGALTRIDEAPPPAKDR